MLRIVIIVFENINDNFNFFFNWNICIHVRYIEKTNFVFLFIFILSRTWVKLWLFLKLYVCCNFSYSFKSFKINLEILLFCNYNFIILRYFFITTVYQSRCLLFNFRHLTVSLSTVLGFESHYTELVRLGRHSARQHSQFTFHRPRLFH